MLTSKGLAELRNENIWLTIDLDPTEINLEPRRIYPDPMKIIHEP